MSIDLFMFCFRNGDQALFHRSIAEGAWAPFIGWEDDKTWELEFPDGGHSTVDLDEGSEISHLAINRPTASPAFWVGLFLIMDETGSILLQTGGGPSSFLTDEDFVRHYPPESAEELRSYFWVDRRRED